MFNGIASKPGFTPFVVGAVLALQLLAIGISLKADSEYVYLYGQRMGSLCSFKESTGVPCPTCGMTRSVVMTLRGNITGAFAMNPAAMAATIGLAAVTSGLFALALMQQSVKTRRRQAFEQWFRRSLLVYFALVLVVWIVNYVRLLVSG